jgi:SAM-dependent methyltransferase
MAKDPLVSRLRAVAERASGFSGWEFDDPEAVRRLDPGPPWDYEALARERLRTASRAVDLGTGGGEVLSRVADGSKARMVATEEWVVNAPLAARRLGPSGIPVVRCSSERLPFADGSFDLVLSRHEAIEPREIERVLSPGGVFLTQQVAPDYWHELRTFFPRMTVFAPHDVEYRAAFEAMGYDVRFERCEYRVAVRDLETLAYRLLLTPWTIRGFDVERDADALLAVEQELGTAEGIVLSEGLYLLEAVKGGGMSDEG